MLQKLHIHNYALIAELQIQFSGGFTVITGETGAGKSILLGALGLLLGNRADSKSIKTGEKKCVVEATFLLNRRSEDYLRENDIDADDNECIIRREVTDSGKSRAFINDTPVTLANLKELGGLLIDIHSQHQNLLMGDAGFLLDTVDSVAQNEKLRAQYAETYQTYRQIASDLSELRRQASQAATETDYLRYQLQQIDDLQIQAGEENELEDEAKMLEHTEDIKTALYHLNELLTGDEISWMQKMKHSINDLERLSSVFAPAAEMAERLNSARIELADISDEAENQMERMEFDPNRLQYIQERLDKIYTILKRHNVGTTEEIIRQAEEMRQRLNNMENVDFLIAEAEKKLKDAEQRLNTDAQLLTKSREKTAKTLSAQLQSRMNDLGMPNAKIEVCISESPQPDITGKDTVSLLFSANKNVPMRDVSEIASGGETARLMLALKTIISQYKALPTVIFDEIDTGVSGTMAEKMALSMKDMSESCQVICITHLPQIAACGDNHLKVYKTEDETSVSTHITLLNQEERINEIANMLSGSVITKAATDNAKELLGLSQ
ncbi:MAG: DNA repair protein RecN [Bacteroidaceae bacterium]|nr:DNA repair protein RecN [Bacteroidaceae bacterium]